MEKNKIIVTAVAVVVVGALAFSSCGNKKILEAPKEKTVSTGEQVSDEEFMQQVLIKRFGTAPDGFKWRDDGTVIALGDKSLTSEEVAYNYLKSASMLDFEMLQKSSNKSTVARTYQGYYEDEDALDTFKRKIYKESLKSITVDRVVDTALFAEGKETFTFKINILDLSDKDFWRPDSDKIYNDLYTYYREEQDSAKAKKYIYDYILSWYTAKSAPRHDVEIDLVVTKNNKTGAWLVTGDDSLNKLCTYDNGEVVNDYIYSCYQEWFEDVLDGKVKR